MQDRRTENSNYIRENIFSHYNAVTMDSIPSQITSLTIVYSAVYSGTDQRKHQSSASLAFVRGIHRGPVNSPHKWPVTRKMFPFDYGLMFWYYFSSLPWRWEKWGALTCAVWPEELGSNRLPGMGAMIINMEPQERVALDQLHSNTGTYTEAKLSDNLTEVIQSQSQSQSQNHFIIIITWI